MLNIIIFSIVVCSAIISSLSVVLSQNPVYSVIALVLVFFNFSCLSIMLGLEFIPINLLVIYCGAIAILFLFVILTLNIKIAELNKQNFELLPACVFLVVAFLILCFISLHSNFIPLFIFEQTNFMFLIDFTKHLSITSTEFESWRTLNTNAKCLAETLFTTYFYAFILSGYILLLAMFGSICLTLKQKFNSKSQKVFNQVLADFNETIKY